MQITQVWHTLTLVHSIEDLVEFFFCVLAVMFPPALARLTPQNHQLSLRSSQCGKVGDLYYYRPEKHGTVQPAGHRMQRQAYGFEVLNVRITVSLNLTSFKKHCTFVESHWRGYDTLQ